MTQNTRTTTVAVLAVLMLIAAPAVAPIAAATSAPTSAPDGMVALPGDQVGAPLVVPKDVPGGTLRGPPDHVETSSSAWDVQSTRHAGDLDVEIGTIGADAGPIGSDGELALVISDDANHDGRTVAVDARTLEDSLGFRPGLAYITHESGDEYTVPIEYDDGFATWDVREFSSNTVTFSGEISIAGNPATDGASYSYDLEDASGADNFTIDLTGSLAEGLSTQSGSGNGSISIGGTTDPVGPNGETDPRLNVTADTQEDAGLPDDGSATKSSDEILVDEGGGRQSEIWIENPPDKVDQITVPVSGESTYGTADGVEVYLQQGAPDGSPTSGTQVASGLTLALGENTIDVSGFDVTGDNLTIGFNSAEGNQGQGSFVAVYDTSTTGGNHFQGDAGNYPATEITVSGAAEGVTVSDDTTASASLGTINESETVTTSLDLSTSSTSLSFGEDAPHVNWELKPVERTETVDPAIEVNGNTTSYTGTLSDGETTSLSTSTDWLRSGTNTVNVTVSSGTSGPAGEVGLEYNHSARADQTVEYSGHTWAERYNVSRTFAEDQADANLTIPFASDRVVALGEIEKRYDGGDWSPVLDENTHLEGTELTIELGDVVANETVDVRAAGRKVTVSDGSIDVLEPTVEGDSLDTKIQVLEAGSAFEIDVSGTQSGNWLHYATDESWSSPEDHAVVGAGQQLRLPGASSGSTARVRTIEIEATTSAGKAEIEVISPSEPRIKVRDASSADSVDLAYHNTVSGTEYVLRDPIDERTLDSDTAESPVYFTVYSGDYGTLTIEEGDGSSGGGGGPVVTTTTSGGTSSTSILAILAGITVALVALYAASARFGGGRSEEQTRVVVGGGALLGYLALELMTDGIVAIEIVSAIVSGPAGAIGVGLVILIGVWLLEERTRASIPKPILGIAGLGVLLFMVETIAPGTLSDGLEEVSPVLWLGLIGGGGFLAWRYVKAQSRPDTRVSLQLRGK